MKHALEVALITQIAISGASYFFHCCSNRRPQEPLSDHCRKFVWLCIVFITWVPLTRSNYSIYTERPVFVKWNRLFTEVYFLLIFFISAISALQCCLLSWVKEVGHFMTATQCTTTLQWSSENQVNDVLHRLHKVSGLAQFVVFVSTSTEAVNSQPTQESSPSLTKRIAASRNEIV